MGEKQCFDCPMCDFTGYCESDTKCKVRDKYATGSGRILRENIIIEDGVTK